MALALNNLQRNQTKPNQTHAYFGHADPGCNCQGIDNKVVTQRRTVI